MDAKPSSLTFWAMASGLLVLLSLWHSVQTLGRVAVLAISPHLARLQPSDGRSVGALSGHLCSIVNTVVCAVAVVLCFGYRLVDGSLGVLFTMPRRAFHAAEPLPSCAPIFFLGLSAYSATAAIWAATGWAGPIDRIAGRCQAVALRALIGLAAAAICMVDNVPELAFALLVQEIPGPGEALWLLTSEDRARGGEPMSATTGWLLALSILVCRVVVFGLCLAWFVAHPEAPPLATDASAANAGRLVIFMLCVVIYVLHLSQFARLVQEVRQHASAQKQSGGLASRLQVGEGGDFM